MPMTTPIDAFALRAIYTGPYTAPDGTERRGLWDRCPAAAPNDIISYDADTGRQWGHPQDLAPILSDEDDIANAALCRVAVEDWLGLTLHFAVTTTQNSVVSTVMLRGGDVDLGSFETTFDGRTIQHALVAAAHAVLDAQGVPA